jgi:hypothetical protein
MDEKKQGDGDGEKSFTTEVKISGINPYVDVPEPLVKEVGNCPKAAVLVKVAAIDIIKDELSPPPKKRKLDKDAAQLKAIGRLAPGGWFRSTLVPSRSGATRLYLDMWMRETAGVGVGDTVCITLKPDPGSREVPMPDQLHKMLKANAEAQALWDKLSPSRQREILIYLNFLKTPEAVERNVRKVMANLLAKGESNT